MESSRRKFAAEEGDHLTLLNLYQAFVTKGKKDMSWCRNHYVNYKSLTRAVSIRNQLRRCVERFGIDVSESLSGVQGGGNAEMGEKIRRCLTTGYFSHAAKMQPDGTFKSVNGLVMHAHPSSLMFNRKAEWVVFHEIMETGGKPYIRDVSKIERSWLLEYGNKFYRSS